MARSISDGEAIEAALNIQLPSLRIEMPLKDNNEFARLRAARSDKAFADMGVWLGLCSLASRYKGHALPLNYGQLAEWLLGSHGKSTVMAEHLNALLTAGLVFIGDDGSLYIPTIETELVRYGKMIVGGARGGRPRGKRKRRR